MADMTIVQALRRIKKLKGELADLRRRAEGAVSYPTSREPAFEFSKSVEQAENVRFRVSKGFGGCEAGNETGSQARSCNLVQILRKRRING